MNKLKRLWKNNRDDFEILTDETSIACYEYFYPNAINPRTIKN